MSIEGSAFAKLVENVNACSAALAPKEVTSKDHLLKFGLTNSQGLQVPNLKCIVALQFDALVAADIKVTRPNGAAYLTSLQQGTKWHLSQIQDASAYVREARYELSYLAGDAEKMTLTDFSISKMSLIELSKFSEKIGRVFKALVQARSSLLIPRKKTVFELVSNSHLRSLHPPCPPDVTFSFFIEAPKLALSAYTLGRAQNWQNKIDILSRTQIECVVPWLADALDLLHATIPLAQHLHRELEVARSCRMYDH